MLKMWVKMGDRLILIDAAAPQKSAQLTHRCQGWSPDLLWPFPVPFLFRTLIIIDYHWLWLSWLVSRPTLTALSPFSILYLDYHLLPLIIIDNNYQGWSPDLLWPLSVTFLFRSPRKVNFTVKLPQLDLLNDCRLLTYHCWRFIQKIFTHFVAKILIQSVWKFCQRFHWY